MKFTMRLYNRQYLKHFWRLTPYLKSKSLFWGLITGFMITFLVIRSLESTFSVLLPPRLRNIIAGDIVDFSEADNITGFPYLIVPNWVHFIMLRKDQITFTEMITIRAAHQVQKPERLIIHCDRNKTLGGKYWDMLQDIPELEVKHIIEPTHIFGQPMGNVFHASDVARIRMMMEYGGIFLDNDVYLIRPLDVFRKFEFAIGWDENQFMGTQVLIAHRNARLFKLWRDSYKRYKPELWYYNAGELPTVDFLYKDPSLVHRVKLLFGVHFLISDLYQKPWPQWKDQYSVHLLMRHRSYLDKESPIKEFDEFNIRTYNQTWGEMARLILFGSTDLLPADTTSNLSTHI